MGAWVADLVVLIHFLYIVFLITGPVLFLVLGWRRLRTIHLAAIGLAVVIQGLALLCPLTALEIWLRGGWLTGAEAPGFIGRYIAPVVYPGLTQRTVTALTLLLAAVTLAVYLRVPGKPRGGGAGRAGEEVASR